MTDRWTDRWADERMVGKIPLLLQTLTTLGKSCSKFVARQMGPMYFMLPRKVQIFGVRLDVTPLTAAAELPD